MTISQMKQPVRGSLLSLPFLLVVGITVAPILFIYLSLVRWDQELWAFLAETILWSSLANTVILAVVAGVLALIFGLSLAWLVVHTEFRGRAHIEKILLLPLAVPPYIMAFVYLGFFDYTGTVATFLREQWGLNWLPPVRSVGGAAFILALCLFPYVYLLARTGFYRQSSAYLEAGASLGLNRWQQFLRIQLPLIWPWCLGGLSLVIMESVSDFGAVSILSVDTMTTAIYKTWLGLFSFEGAAQVASLLITLVIVFLIVEFQVRNRESYVSRPEVYATQPVRWALRPRSQVLVWFWIGGILFFSFLLPLGQILFWVWHIGTSEARDFGQWLLDSLYIGLSVSALSVGLLLVLISLNRWWRNALSTWSLRFSTLGYAIPGPVLAVGLMAVFYFFGWGDWVGSFSLLTLALIVRFLAVGFQPLFSSYKRIPRAVDEAALTLRASSVGIWRALHWPWLKTGSAVAFALVLIDTMKEMPITLMLRPFGLEPLSVKIYGLTAEGEFVRAALPSLSLIVLGLIPVALLGLSGVRR